MNTHRSSKQDIVHHVSDTAMHILYNSYLYGSSLWPQKGFNIGRGMDCTLKDCINVVVNAYGNDQHPIIGSLFFNFNLTPNKRTREQWNHLMIIFDMTVSNDLFFEHEFRELPWHCNWFKFTYTPQS